MSSPEHDPEVTGTAPMLLETPCPRNVARWPLHQCADGFVVVVRCKRWERSFDAPSAEQAFAKCLAAYDEDHPDPTGVQQRMYG